MSHQLPHQQLLPQQHPNRNGRTYEEDLDYVLEKELGGGGSVSESVVGAGGGNSVVKGQEVRPLVNVDNYAKVYGGGSNSSSGVQANSSEPQPYHTRYDSKPFSYIR
jgi:hypothetical protein